MGPHLYLHQKEAADLEKASLIEPYSLPMCFSRFKKTDLNDLEDTVVMKTQILMIWPFVCHNSNKYL